MAVFLAGVALWLLIGVLGSLTRDGHLGPVALRNLEQSLDAGALFYTEVDPEHFDFHRYAP